MTGLERAVYSYQGFQMENQGRLSEALADSDAL